MFGFKGESLTGLIEGTCFPGTQKENHFNHYFSCKQWFNDCHLAARFPLVPSLERGETTIHLCTAYVKLSMSLIYINLSLANLFSFNCCPFCSMESYICFNSPTFKPPKLPKLTSTPSGKYSKLKISSIRTVAFRSCCGSCKKRSFFGGEHRKIDARAVLQLSFFLNLGCVLKFFAGGSSQCQKVKMSNISSCEFDSGSEIC